MLSKDPHARPTLPQILALPLIRSRMAQLFQPLAAPCTAASTSVSAPALPPSEGCLHPGAGARPSATSDPPVRQTTPQQGSRPMRGGGDECGDGCDGGGLCPPQLLVARIPSASGGTTLSSRVGSAGSGRGAGSPVTASAQQGQEGARPGAAPPSFGCDTPKVVAALALGARDYLPFFIYTVWNPPSQTVDFFCEDGLPGCSPVSLPTASLRRGRFGTAFQKSVYICMSVLCAHVSHLRLYLRMSLCACVRPVSCRPISAQ